MEARLTLIRIVLNSIVVYPEKFLATDIENEQTEERLDDKTVEDLMNFLYSQSPNRG
jgi:hypothetical protein